MPATTMPGAEVVEKLENAKPLDPVVKTVRGIVSKALGPQPVRDALHGVWLGHPLHPVLTDVPIGMWSAASLLDLVPGTAPASTALVAAGCASAVPTAVTGWADWSQLHPQHQRVGFVHAASNVVALTFYAASLAARMRGRAVRGRALGFMGLAAMTAGGYLGGHLSFRQSAGANHNADTVDLFPSGWQPVGALADLPDGELTKRTVDGVDVLLMRRGQHIDAIANKCTHLSGPLSDGEFKVEGGQGCVVCPWHGSTFRLADGSVVHGPATSPQPRFNVRVNGGNVEVKLPSG